MTTTVQSTGAVLQAFPLLFRSSDSSVPLSFLFRSSFVPLFLSSDFSVPISFLFSFLQTFPFLFCSSLPLFRPFRSSFVPLLRSSTVHSLFLFSVLLSARHFLDGGVFRSIGNCYIFFFTTIFYYFSVLGPPDTTLSLLKMLKMRSK